MKTHQNYTNINIYYQLQNCYW